MYIVQLEKAKVEHNESVVVRFLILKIVKPWICEPNYNFIHKFCDVNNFEELELDAKSLYFALAEKNLTACIRPAKEINCEKLQSNDFDESLVADASGKFVPQTFRRKHRKQDTTEPRLFKNNFRCPCVKNLLPLISL